MQNSTARLVRGTLAALALLLVWDASSLDIVVAQWSGGPHGFALRDNWWLSHVLHADVKYAAWLLIVVLCAGLAWPVGPLTRLPFRRRLQLPAVALLSTLAVSSLKRLSATGCPRDLEQFGGVARHLSHWSGWFVADGSSGHCFPAGHATTGFAFIAGYFALRADLPRLARVWLAAALFVGFGLGLVQQLRGAHFMSHTLWTAWICWTLAWSSDPLFAPGRARRARRIGPADPLRGAVDTASPGRPPGWSTTRRQCPGALGRSESRL